MQLQFPPIANLVNSTVELPRSLSITKGERCCLGKDVIRLGRYRIIAHSPNGLCLFELGFHPCREAGIDSRPIYGRTRA